MKITDYDFIGSESHKDFIKMVNDYIKDGWQPYGNPVIYNENEKSKKPFYYQAMVKY